MATRPIWLLLLAYTEALKLNPFSSSPKTPPTRVAVLGGGFAGLTAARTLTDNPNTEVLLIDQREYFEYTPGILRAWVNPKCHRALVNPIRRLLRSKQAEFKRVPPGCACRVVEASSEEKPPLTFSIDDEDGTSLVTYECDYAILATGGELSPVSDDRQLPDGTIIARRRRLEEQVASVMDEATSALVVGGGLTGVEMAAELAEKLGPGTVTLAVGPRRAERGFFPGDPGAGLLPGFRDTCNMAINFGRGGATRHVRAWLERKGVTILERWAVPPPPGSTLSNEDCGSTAMRAPACARTWRDAGDCELRDINSNSWERAGPQGDLQADVVFDCRGLRPNNRDSFGGSADEKKAQSKLGLPLESIAPSGWLRVDPKFRLAARNPDGPVATEENPAAGLEPVYNGRVYCVGDAAEKDKNERTAANAHAEGEYAALDILQAVEEKPPLPEYVAPPRLCAISLGKWNGVVVLGRWVALRGFLAAIAKMIIQLYFVNFLPLPYWLMRRLPGRQPRRYGGSGGSGYVPPRSARGMSSLGVAGPDDGPCDVVLA